MRKMAMSAVALLTAMGVLETLMPGNVSLRWDSKRGGGFDLVLCMLGHQCYHILLRCDRCILGKVVIWIVILHRKDL